LPVHPAVIESQGLLGKLGLEFLVTLNLVEDITVFLHGDEEESVHYRLEE